MEKNLAQIVEAILFASPQSISPKQLLELVGMENIRDAREIIENLNQQYDLTGRVFRIREVAGGFQMRTEPQFRPWIQKLEPIKPIKLSLPTMETLAIVAYRQPITRANIEFIRGVDSSHTLKVLLQRKLIRVAGKEKVPGRPILYGTTNFFLEVFGLNKYQQPPQPDRIGYESRCGENSPGDWRKSRIGRIPFSGRTTGTAEYARDNKLREAHAHPDPLDFLPSGALCSQLLGQIHAFAP